MLQQLPASGSPLGSRIPTATRSPCFSRSSRRPVAQAASALRPPRARRGVASGGPHRAGRVTVRSLRGRTRPIEDPPALYRRLGGARVATRSSNANLRRQPRDAVGAQEALVYVALGGKQNPFASGVFPVERVLTGVCPASA